MEQTKPMKSMAEQCLDLILEAPSTSLELASTLGATREQINGCTSRLMKAGKIQSQRFLQMLPHEPDRIVSIYTPAGGANGQ